jgi:hypothetical protein
LQQQATIPLVADDEGHDEKRDTQNDGNSGNEVNKVLDLNGNGSFCQPGTPLQRNSIETSKQPTKVVSCLYQTLDLANDSTVTGVDYNAHAGTLDAVGGEKCQIFSFQGVVVGALNLALLWLGFASQRRVVHLKIVVS